MQHLGKDIVIVWARQAYRLAMRTTIVPITFVLIVIA